MSSELGSYLERPLAPVDPEVAAAVASGPMDPAGALSLSDIDRLLDPAPAIGETGWCTLDDGVGYVAVRTAMPLVSTAMVDWWFDWHPREPIRYRIWHPRAHRSNSVELPAVPGAKAHWGTVHHPVEDVGIGMVHARIAFKRPTELGMSVDLPAGATIVGGYAGDDRRHIQHTIMVHVFLNEGSGVVLRSRFWIGAAIRPYGVLGPLGQRLLNNRAVRRAIIPAGVTRALANHCTEEYANLATLLPELYERFGPQSFPDAS
jgi:phloretin hydrolase